MKNVYEEIIGNSFIAIGLAIAALLAASVLGLFLSLAIESWERVGRTINGFDASPRIEEPRREARP